MKERELLELAAKSAGVELWPGAAWREEMGAGLLKVNGKDLWNPLQDDGDALRLLVQFCLSVEQTRHCVEVRIGKELLHRFVAMEPTDRGTAFRRSIVCAVVEMALKRV